MKKLINQYLYDWYKELMENSPESIKVKNPDNYSDDYDFIWNLLTNQDKSTDILKDFLYNSMKGIIGEIPDFVEDILLDISEHVVNYSNPLGYFDDISYGGCASGLVGMFIYDSDCKKFYIDNIDDMEDFVDEYIEYELQRGTIPRYTYICWICYEEICSMLYNYLF